MGLDAVEMVMAIEEEFSIEISNECASPLLTVGEMHAFILGALRSRGESPDAADLWERLKAIVIDQLGVGPEAVIPSARFVEDLGAG